MARIIEIFLLLTVGGLLLWQWLTPARRQNIHHQAKITAWAIVAVALLLVLIRVFQAAWKQKIPNFLGIFLQPKQLLTAFGNSTPVV